MSVRTRRSRMFDLVAPFYDRAMRLLGANHTEAVDVLEVVKGELVIDIGGGTGLGARAAVQRVGCHALVIDHNPAMLRHGRCDGCVGCARGDAAHLPLPDTIADGVLILDALHHFLDPPAALAEAARVLKPGRRLVLLELDSRHPAVKVLAALERFAGEPGVMWSPGQLEVMLKAAGLTPVEVRVSGFGVLASAERTSVM